MNVKNDYIIAGLGLSGAVLAYKLLKAGKKILVVDHFNPNSSSRVAAGLINPVTGRRVVKSWMADTLIPCSMDFFQSVENETGLNFYHPTDVLEIVHTTKEVNDWDARIAENDISRYFIDDTPDADYAEKICAFKKIYRITSSGWMNIPVFIDLVRNMLRERSLLLEKRLNPALLSTSAGDIRYQDQSARRIIFCEGYLSASNSLWKWLPFVPAKGEILTIRCTELPEDYILLSGIFVVPLGDKKFRVGSTYEWNFETDEPTEEGKNKLISLLNDFLKVEYEILDHRAGIRPTVKDRRPFIGVHPENSSTCIFNGMGTKGVQLAPYFADRFIDHLEMQHTLPPEVDVKRWNSLLGTPNNLSR